MKIFVSIMGIALSSVAFAATECPKLAGVYGKCMKYTPGSVDGELVAKYFEIKQYEMRHRQGPTNDYFEIKIKPSKSRKPTEVIAGEIGVLVQVSAPINYGDDDHKRLMTCKNNWLFVQDTIIEQAFPGEAPNPEPFSKTTSFSYLEDSDRLYFAYADNRNSAYRVICERVE